MYELAKILLEAKANPNIKASNGAAPIHWAITNNNPKMVKLLLESKADIESLNSKNVSPLYLASYLGYAEIVDLLLENNANINFSKNGKNSLKIAKENNHKETLTILTNYSFNKCHFSNKGVDNIAYFTLIKDEDDIIFENLIWHFAIGFRKFFIMDNLSNDSTIKHINKFRKLTEEQAKIFIISDPVIEYIQSKKSTAASNFIKTIWPEVKWVFPTDADEFWFPKQSLNEILETIPEHVEAITVLSTKYYPTEDYYSFNNSAKFYQKIHFRDDSITHEKIALKPNKDIIISQGNHFIIKNNGENTFNIIGDEIGLTMYEFQSRSIEQTNKKFTNGMKANLAAKAKHLIEPHLGTHWDYYSQYIEKFRNKAAEAKFNESFIDSSHAIDQPFPMEKALEIFQNITNQDISLIAIDSEYF